MSRFSFSREPVAWLHLLAMGLALLVAFGLQFSEIQIGAVMAFSQALAAALARSQVTPESEVQRRVKAARQKKAASPS